MLVFGCLLICFALMFWASGRGYGTSLDAYYMVMSSDPYSCDFSLTGFGYLLHPLYLLAQGDIQSFRIIGIVLLAASAALFGFAHANFCAARIETPQGYILVALTVTICVFLQFASFWLATPNYNSLNLCALLVFYSGVIWAATPPRIGSMHGNVETVSVAILTGLAIAVMMLTKPTSGIIAALLGVAWVITLRTPRPVMCIAVTGAAALLGFLVGAFWIDGSIAAYVQRNILGLHIFSLQVRPGGNLHGLRRSFFGPFRSEEQWMIIKDSGIGLAILGVALVAIFDGVRLSRWRFPIIAGAAALTLLILALRALRIENSEFFAIAFTLWYAAFGISAVVGLIVVLRAVRNSSNTETRRFASAAILLSIGPIIYAFGTGGAVILQAPHAGVFWSAALLLVALLAPIERRRRSLNFVGLLCSVATVGLIIGGMAASGALGASIWRQNEPLSVGPHGGSALLTDSQTAHYFKAMQHAANENGFQADAPVIDLSYQGPGLAFALGGRTLGTAWIEDEGSGRVSFSCAALQTVARGELASAWIITGHWETLRTVQAALHCAGLDFPAEYNPVGSADRKDLNWHQTLWKPTGAEWARHGRRTP